MSGPLQLLRATRLVDLWLDLDDARRRLQQSSDPLALRRLRVIGLAAAAPIAVAVAVPSLLPYLPTVDELSLPSPATPVPTVVAAPWTSSSSGDAPAAVVAGRLEHITLRATETLSAALGRHGVGNDDVAAVLRALRGALPAGAVQPGATFAVQRDGAALARLVFATTTDEGVPRTITAVRAHEPVPASPTTAMTPSEPAAAARARFDVSVDDAIVDVVVEGLAGTVGTTLPEGIVAAGGDLALVDRFVDVFAWEVDFHDASRVGDEFRVLVEKRYATVGGARRFLGYGKVVAAEYVTGGQAHRAFAYTSADGRVAGVFDESGTSRRRTLLKNPIDLGAVTSTGDGRRGSPEARGIDYAAPLGTPVWSTGDGVVVDAGFDKAAGNRVIVDHGGRLSTEYLHLSRFADGIKPGARVAQKQLLGFVGSTGTASVPAKGAAAGPHLHYGLRRGGELVDLDSALSTSAEPLPVAYRTSFDAFVGPLLAQLRILTRA
jgi:murein DD-endopeptidase MepM/ murein hydrolase activator NlpD